MNSHMMVIACLVISYSGWLVVSFGWYAVFSCCSVGAVGVLSDIYVPDDSESGKHVGLDAVGIDGYAYACIAQGVAV